MLDKVVVEKTQLIVEGEEWPSCVVERDVVGAGKSEVIEMVEVVGEEIVGCVGMEEKDVDVRRQGQGRG